ncbi:VWA domain-containing protein [Embleya sp. NPDC020630]|uniref:VWA domain-containing protein n=1 Tax=Embleya sp. NPDC020630 TaxID=3363979 RepID=UPI0037A11C11
MTKLAKGANAPLSTGNLHATLSWRPGPGVPDVDVSALLLNGERRVGGDADMVFYNQPGHPSGAVGHRGKRPGSDTVALDLDRAPDDLAAVILAASADGGAFGRVPGLRLELTDAATGASVVSFDLDDATTETAFVFGEVYRRAGGWRFRAVGQGYDSGLAGLATDFGISVTAEEPSAPVVYLKKQRLISMEKRLARDGHDTLLSLTKKAAIGLEKHGLAEHTARVALVLDMSISMDEMYESGRVQALAERVLSLALRFDDDGEVDVFPFAAFARRFGGMDLDNYRGRVATVYAEADVGPWTDYGEAMRAVREYYFGSGEPRSTPLPAAAPPEPPVFVMFVTDGATSEEDAAREHIRSSGYEPVFWQFMAIGEPDEFEFLAELDDLSGRFLDNTAYFTVADLNSLSDDELFERLVGQYPQWLAAARSRGLIRRPRPRVLSASRLPRSGHCRERPGGPPSGDLRKP